MSIAIISLAVGFYLLNDIQQDKTTETKQSILNEELDESNKRLSVAKEQFYNEKHSEEFSKEQVIKIITEEVNIQKQILSKYQSLSPEMKTDNGIDIKFINLSKYSWSEENSIISELENSP